MSKKIVGEKISWQEFAERTVEGDNSWAVDDDLPTAPGAMNLPKAPGSMSAPQDRPRKPLPTQPPYTAYVANLSYELTQDDLGMFFVEMGPCDVVEPRLVLDRNTQRSKGFGYVEFADLESLKIALDLDGVDVIDRPITVEVAELRESDKNRNSSSRYNNNDAPMRESRANGASQWRNDGPVNFEPSSRSSSRGDLRRNMSNNSNSSIASNNSNPFDSFDRNAPRPALSTPASDQRPSSRGDLRRNMSNDSNSSMARNNSNPFDNFDRNAPRPEISAPAPARRTKLNLAPRSKPIDPLPTPPQRDEPEPKPTPSASAPTKPKSNPFGAAKPVDTQAKLLEVEKKLAKQQLADEKDSDI